MSATPWTAERDVDAARAAHLIARVAPHLGGHPVTPLERGWDNTVFSVRSGDDHWAFRFPRRAIALPGVRRELAVLARIAHLLPLAIPVAEVVGVDDHPDDPWPFSGARLIPGRELADWTPATSDLPRDARTAAGAALGAFLRALHHPRVAAAVADLDLPTDPMERAWPRARSASVREQLAQLVAAGTWSGDAAVDALLDDADPLDAPTASSEPTVLVHGDLHVRHVLVDDAREATGVIDWGDVCLGDPAIDLAIAYAGFAGPARAALLTAYGGIDAERELRSRALAVRLSALLAGYAADERREGLLVEALAGLRRCVS